MQTARSLRREWWKRTQGVGPIDIDFEALFARSPNPYVVLNADLVIVWMNDAYLRVTMRERAEIQGRKMFEAFPSEPGSDSHRLLSQSFERVLETGEADEIALIRYDIRERDGRMSTRYWSATHTPMLNPGGEVEYILQHTVDVTELHDLRRLRDEAGVVHRAGTIQARNDDLSRQTERLKGLFEQSPGFMAVLRGPEHRFELANATYRRLLGNRELIGRTTAEAVPEAVDQGFVELLDEIYASGRVYLGRSEKVTLHHPDDDESETIYADFIFQPIVDEDGVTSGIFVQGHDVTEQVVSAQAQELMIHELNHRVKNTLAIVQSLAAQSFRKADDAQAARAVFDARLAALAAAHNVLTSAHWESAGIRAIVEQTLGASVGALIDRFDIGGPETTLPPQSAVALTMTLHELATNAIKYGALSNARGKVGLRWDSERDGDDCVVTIEWRESGGPEVVHPTRRGFGTRLIERGLGEGRGSSVNLSFEREGLACRIVSRHRLSAT